jgi:iron-sulfur cluster assembly protein
MFTVTRQAAQQIISSSEQGANNGLVLRVAAQSTADGSIEYLLGFDSVGDKDIKIKSNGVTIIFDKSQQTLLEGTTLDYVEIESGQFNFIFLNPNDPYYKPPKQQ